MKIIDCKGLACPKPVILTKKELEAIDKGEIEVIVDNDAARENVSRFAKSQGFEYSVSEKDGLIHIVIKKDAPQPQACEIMNFDNKKLVILVGTDKFGKGDEKLGTALMKSYLYAMTENSIKPEKMFFVNSGVNLTTEGSEVIESLKALESQGVEIMSCGTCLDFYGLKEKLIIGGVTNMYTIVENMNSASNTITL
jgi:selenium metabolism protein YedF